MLFNSNNMHILKLSYIHKAFRKNVKTFVDIWMIFVKQMGIIIILVIPVQTIM